MKSVIQLIQENQTSPPPKKIKKPEPHYINLSMNYNGGRRGRKTDKERKEISEEYKLKVNKNKIYLDFT
tara:strand:- start:99 stop:305 length:207 start_codon:yes stop_codon:yes gene_type:complete